MPAATKHVSQNVLSLLVEVCLVLFSYCLYLGRCCLNGSFHLGCFYS